MAAEPPITTNPFPVPIEETAPNWWLDDPEPISQLPTRLLELAIVLAVIGVLAGLIIEPTIHPHPRRLVDEIDAMRLSGSEEYPLEPFPAIDNEVENDLAESSP